MRSSFAMACWRNAAEGGKERSSLRRSENSAFFSSGMAGRIPYLKTTALPLRWRRRRDTGATGSAENHRAEQPANRRHRAAHEQREEEGDHPHHDEAERPAPLARVDHVVERVAEF